MSEIVLVHGGWTRSWVWGPVIRQLEALGIACLTVDLHRGSLGADTAAVQGVVDGCSSPPIACGWSYGGCVITGLEPSSVQHLAYVAAFVPDVGESPLSLLRTVERTPGSRALVADAHGSLAIDPRRARDALCHDCDPRTVEWVIRQLEPQAGSGFNDSPRSAAWRVTPSSALICTGDRFLSPSLQMRMAERMSTAVEVDASHGVLWSRSATVAEFLVGSLGTAT